MDHRNGRTESAVERARQALALRPDSDGVINNAITMYGNVGDHDASWALAKGLAASSTSYLFRGIARANCLRYEASLDGSLQDLVDVLKDLGQLSEASALPHFAGVSYLNLSLVEQAKGDAAAALEHADLAVQELSQTHQSDELASAYLARAVVAATSGRLESARDDVTAARDVVPMSWRAEWLLETADIEVAYGSADTAASLLDEARATAMLRTLRNYAITIEARLALRLGQFDLARDRANAFEVGSPSEVPGFMSRQLAIQAHVAVVGGLDGADDLLSQALALAEKQGAIPWVRYLRVLKALRTPKSGRSVETLARRISDDEMSAFDPFAELISSHFSTFDEATVERIAIHASRRRERWLPALRAEVANTNSPSRWRAGEILDRIGTAQDVSLLRALARTNRGTAPRSLLGRTLARRLATRVIVEDLGRIEVRYGGIVVAATSIRRKVLAMLTFLLTRPRFAATRDEVIDALWPELAPDVAMNSLNQTVYFLRRVFEPTYQEDLSAGYVHHSSDVLWLDPELVTSRSAECFSFIDAIGSDLDPTLVARLSDAYTERFALDFTYEEWAVPFRTALHAAYLQIIEAAVTQDMASGHQDRAIELARRALDRDPAVESLEVALLRLYRATGAHAAAAEQYAHYASVLKEELGVDAPPLSSL